MKNLVVGLLIFIVFIIQTTVLRYFEIFGVVPNLCLVLIVSFSLLEGKKQGAIVGIIVGLLYDIMFSNALGVTALIYYFIGYVGGMFNKKVFTSTVLTPFVFTAIATVVYNFYQVLCFYLSNCHFDYLNTLGSIIVIELLYNSVICVVFYRLMPKLIKTPSFNFRVRRRS